MSKQSTINVTELTSRINSSDEVVITAHFKRMNIHFPFTVTGASGMRAVFEYLEKASSRYDRPTKYYYDQMDLWEATLCANTKNGYLREKTVLDTVEIINRDNTDSPIDAEEFQTMWCVNVLYLVKRGRIPSCSFKICSETHHENQMRENKAEYKATFLCGVCAVKSKQCCERCEKIYYCCREHQLADWNDHKKVCVRAVPNPLKLKKK